jgi:dolichol-phosphate mannosyltransferase
MPFFIKRILANEKTKFIIVGGTGFVVNYIALAVFYHLLGLPILIAQIIGSELALLATFVGNNYWAFQNHSHVLFWTKLWRYHLSAIGGLLINSFIVVLLVHQFQLYYGLGLLIGSAAGLVWNYTMYKKFVFKTHKNTIE